MTTDIPDWDGERFRNRYLPAAQLRPGMVIAHALSVSVRERIVFQLPAGTTLDAKMVYQLQQRGAEHACIREPDTRSEEQRTAQRDYAHKRLSKIFSAADLESPATRTLFDAVLEFRCR